MELANSNYYSLEANREYLSVSQYKDFMTCEAMAMARINGEWGQEKSEALLVGSYVHSWADGTIEQFKQENKEIFTQKGELKAKYVQADEMIRTLENDQFCMYVLNGDKEVAMTATIGGVPWKCKMDVLNLEKSRFVDLKTVKDFKKVWSDYIGAYTNFVEAYGYITQMAVYREIIKLNTGGEIFEPFIVAVTKQSPPDKAIINFDDDNLEIELENVIKNVPRIKAVKEGLEEPLRCEKCDYCRSTKQIQKVIHFTELF